MKKKVFEEKTFYNNTFKIKLIAFSTSLLTGFADINFLNVTKVIGSKTVILMT